MTAPRPPEARPRTLAVVGGGWAGLAAAVAATGRGHRVTLFEMAPHTGGRARDIDAAGFRLDNGQHILIGAYAETLALMRTIGVDERAAFVRTPLRLAYPDRTGLQLEAGPPLRAFGAAVWRQRGWTRRERLALLAASAGWLLRGFRCEPGLTVAALTARLPRAVRDDLIDPLSVAALNTPAGDASAAVFLRVLRDALFSGPGSADLLLPKVGLGALLPEPATHWLHERGAVIRCTTRVRNVAPAGEGWSVDGEPFDQVVLATSPNEAARLAQPIAPAWAAEAGGLRYEPIVTVYLRGEGLALPAPMLALHDGAEAPAQFVFDRGQLGGPSGLFAFVVSGAQRWVDRGLAATTEATIAQARAALGLALQPVRTLTEKRATFRCTPRLARPAAAIARGLHAAGDYVAGPYPATLEGAVRSGLEAARALG